MSIANQKTVRFRDSISEFNNIKANALSGNLVIQVAEVPSWMLCFSSGRLAGISGGIDAIERWERNLALASLNVPLDRLVKSTNHQEIFLNSNKIAQECAIQEVLFDIIQFSQNQGDRLSARFIPINDKNTQVKSILPLLEIQPILAKTIQAWQEWEKQGLASCSPSLFPVIRSSERLANFSNSKHLNLLLPSIDGTRSLRTLAIHHHQRLIDVGQALLPLISSGIITLEKVKQTTHNQQVIAEGKAISELDAVNISIPNTKLSNPRTLGKPPLIACIDDSIAVYKHLEKIIVEYGYRSFGVQDPLKIITSLIKNKPDLIFLDLVMPITNGYEVCEQIRKTPSLATIPIIILTGNDGLIDRVRTKFVGANSFLGKPIEARSVEKMIDKYLERNDPNRTADRERKSASAVKNDRGLKLEASNLTAKRVLVIDDDQNIRQVVSMCLNKLKGWDVLVTASAQAGLDQIDINLPDVIILDVMMPEMDGLAFLRKLRSNSARKMIPVVLLTANRYLPDQDLLTELGVMEVISKPFLPIDLVRQIDRALEGKICL
jgi:two-component system, chemotaxis family, response regulator PixG